MTTSLFVRPAANGPGQGEGRRCARWAPSASPGRGLRGYEVCRFGGYELQDPDGNGAADRRVTSFFDALMERRGTPNSFRPAFKRIAGAVPPAGDPGKPSRPVPMPQGAVGTCQSIRGCGTGAGPLHGVRVDGERDDASLAVRLQPGRC
jgi:hypothetical protein